MVVGGLAGVQHCNIDNIHEFDASNIGIRYQWLKHAASAYLQSAVVAAPFERAGGAASSGFGTASAAGTDVGRCWRRQAHDTGASTTLPSTVARSARRFAAFFAPI